MPKTKKVIVIGDQAYPYDGVSVKIPLTTLAQLLQNEQTAAVKDCITSIRPFVSGHLGRERLSAIELDLEDQVVMVTQAQEVCEEPAVEQFVFIDESRGELIEEPDFRRVIQTIRRRK